MNQSQWHGVRARIIMLGTSGLVLALTSLGASGRDAGACACNFDWTYGAMPSDKPYVSTGYRTADKLSCEPNIGAPLRAAMLKIADIQFDFRPVVVINIRPKIRPDVLEGIAICKDLAGRFGSL